MSRIMIVCGGSGQVALAKKAKEIGHTILCTNLYPDVERSPAFAYADKTCDINILDKENNLKAAIDFKPDAVISDQSDISVPTVAYIAQHLGLPGIGVETAELFTNKYQMRELLRREGFPCPNFSLCYSPQEAKNFLRANKHIVIKPLNSQASRGVHFIESESEIDEKFSDCVKYSNGINAIIAEQRIIGTMFTCEGIKTPNSYRSLICSQKTQFDEYPMISRSLIYSHTNSIFDYHKLKQENERLINAMGLPFGLTHSEYIYSDGEFYLIETAARGGGNNTPLITGSLVGLNMYDILINMALGNSVTEIDDISKAKVNIENDKCCSMDFLNVKPGIFKRFIGLEVFDEYRNNGQLLDYEIGVRKGELIEPLANGTKRSGYYILKADTYELLQKMRNDIFKSVSVDYYEE